MYMEESEEERMLDQHERKPVLDVSNHVVRQSSAKIVLIGAVARFLFYPTLLYNIFRNKIEAEFHWWDEVDEFVLLGAVPFSKDVPLLKKLGVQGVITLNEPYETLVPTSLYRIHGVDHLMIPTRDYLFAPSFGDVCQAVDFIHKKASCGKTTYVHCKAGRGRSTTIVLCYLVEHKHMTPMEAYDHVRSSRPRVLLAACQWQVVLEYYKMVMEKRNPKYESNSPSEKSLQLVRKLPTSRAVLADDGSIVVVTESDLDGCDASSNCTMGTTVNDFWSCESFVCRVQFAGQAALARLSESVASASFRSKGDGFTEGPIEFGRGHGWRCGEAGCGYSCVLRSFSGLLFPHSVESLGFNRLLQMGHTLPFFPSFFFFRM